MRLLEHVVEAGVVELGIKVELLGIASEESLAGIGDAHDLNVFALKILLEEAVNVAVDKADNDDA
jgi:hypothetical protein